MHKRASNKSKPTLIINNYNGGEDIWAALATLVKTARRGTSQQCLADQARISAKTLERIEHGEPISAENLIRILCAMNYRIVISPEGSQEDITSYQQGYEDAFALMTRHMEEDAKKLNIKFGK